jgi:rubrerythrin
MIQVTHVVDGKEYYKCSQCDYNFGTDENIPDEWNMCPVCGMPLYSK